MTEDGWIPVSRTNLETRYPGVYAVGDVNSVGTPKAGVFSEGAAHVVAEEIIAKARGKEPPAPYGGAGACYVEFGAGQVGRVDVNFLSGPNPTGSFMEPSQALVAEKEDFGSSRRARWFGL
jgi:sulfide:quinone oxidoreductase